MPSFSTPYDEVPYRSSPIEWTAPERLALTSLLHGGPRQPIDEYRVLELGCGDGTNLIPMAYYRRHATFVGVDGAHSQIAIANKKRMALGLTNVSFVGSDFQSASATLSGQFDFVIAHGVFSWVSCGARDALLVLCAKHLRQGGLLYLNYNARPGWNVRGLIRDFLMAQTESIKDLRGRAEKARVIAAKMTGVLNSASHPYSQLLANEFDFVGMNHLSHTAHEYLSDFNDAYTRREFLELVGRYDLVYIADGDFNYPSGRLPEGLKSQLWALELERGTTDATADLVCYRQLHSPLLTKHGFVPRPPDVAEFGALNGASCLVEEEERRGAGSSVFKHPSSGYEVEVRSEVIAGALRRWRSVWPRGLRLTDVCSDVGEVIDDLTLLHRNGVIELRVADDSRSSIDAEPLHNIERDWGGHLTSWRHTFGQAERTTINR
jgi:SAM-dependent methyltransferase